MHEVRHAELRRRVIVIIAYEIVAILLRRIDKPRGIRHKVLFLVLDILSQQRRTCVGNVRLVLVLYEEVAGHGDLEEMRM